MTWFDELDEQTQQQWRSRIAKGRMELSASVEETLAETPLDEDMWEDEEGGEDEEGEETDEEDGKDGMPVVDVEPAPSERTIIPPRLSLQTKPIMAISSASPAPPASAKAAPPAASRNETQEQNQQQAGQHTGVFSRLAQRLTSSLAAITTSFQPPVPTPQPPAQEAHIPMPSVQPQQGMEGRVGQPEIAASPIVRLLPAATLLQWEVPREPASAGKQRPGYPTKVHLQAAPKSTSPRPPVSVRAKKETAYAPHEHTEPIPMRKALSAARSAPPTVKIPVAYQTPAMEKAPAPPTSPLLPDELISKVTTNGRLPAILAPEKKAGEPLHPLLPIAMFGSGSFELGQEDAAIANQQIVGSSVVVVMLSSDPGPVVVQYISLQPGSGFTVHLSAPARTKTTFNYVVFQG